MAGGGVLGGGGGGWGLAGGGFGGGGARFGRGGVWGGGWGRLVFGAGGEDGGEEVLGGGGGAVEVGERGFGAGGIALGAEGVQAGDLGALDFGVDAENRNCARVVSFRWGDEIVYADYDLIFFLDGLLEFVSGCLDFPLDETGFDGAQHSSHTVDFGKIVCGQRFNLAGEGFDGVGAGGLRVETQH